VQNGGSRAGQVDYTIEYYDMGQLTKFVKPGAYRIDSTASTSVPNVAWINPDGSKALVAYNESGSTQTVHVNWGNETFSYSLPAQTSATFTWAGTPGSGGTGGTTGPITGYNGLCLDDRSASTTNSNPVQVYTCNGSAAQTWTLTSSKHPADPRQMPRCGRSRHGRRDAGQPLRLQRHRRPGLATPVQRRVCEPELWQVSR